MARNPDIAEITHADEQGILQCARVRTVNCVTCQPKTGQVTYFDPLINDWIENAPTIPIHALAVLPADEEARVRRFLANHNVFINP